MTKTDVFSIIELYCATVIVEKQINKAFDLCKSYHMSEEINQIQKNDTLQAGNISEPGKGLIFAMAYACGICSSKHLL